MEQTDNVQNEGSEQAQEPVAVSPEQFLELQKQFEQLKSSNARLLDESKEWKSKYKSAQQQKEDEKRQLAEEQGNYAELAESLKNELHKTKAELENEKKSILGEKLRFEVAKHARGANDVEDILYNINKVASGVIQIDEDSRSFNGVADAVALVREKKPYLFESKPVSGMADGRPSADVPKEKTFEELSTQEQNNLFADAIVNHAKGIVR